MLFASTLVIAKKERYVRQLAETRRQELYAAQVNLAHEAWIDGDLERAQNLLTWQRPVGDETDLRGFEYRYLAQLCQDESRRTIARESPDEGDARLSLSADGDRLAIADGKFVRIWDFDGGRELAPVALHATPIKALVFSPTNPPLLATADGEGTIKLWDLTTHEPPSILVLAQNRIASHLAFSPNGDKLASSNFDGYVELWDVTTKLRDWSKPGHQDHEELVAAFCITFSPDGEYVATGGADTQVRLWNARTGEQHGPPLERHTAYVYSISFSPDGKLLVSGGWDGRVVLWDVAMPSFRAELLGHRGAMSSVEFSPDSKTLMSGGFDQTIRCWEVATSKPIRILRGHTENAVDSLVFLPSGQSLVSCNRKTVKLWDALPHVNEDVFKHSAWLDAVVLSPDGRMLAVADYHASAVKLWDVRSRRQIETLPCHTIAHRCLSIPSDGQFLASGSNQGTVRLWDLSNCEEIAIYQANSTVSSVSFSSDSKILTAAGADGLKSWSVDTGREIKLFRGDTHSINRAVFSPRGKLLAAHYSNVKLSVCDTNDATEVTSFDPIPELTCLSFSANGRFIAAGAADGHITLFDVRQETTIGPFQGHSELVCAVAFTPDSKTLASAGFDGTVKLWNVATGQTALTLQHLGRATGVSFSADGKLMATSGSDATVRLWLAASPSKLMHHYVPRRPTNGSR